MAADQAVTAAQREEWRLAADKYLEATLKAPSKWAENRYHIFHGYTTILRDSGHNLSPTHADIKALKRMAKDEVEPILFRVEAGFTLGVLRWDSGEREKAAEHYRRVLDLAPTASSLETSRRVATTGADGRSLQFQLVGEVINETVGTVRDNLNILENPRGAYIGPRSQDARVTGIPMTPRGEPDPEILRRLAVGGSECDCCHVKRNQVDQHELLRCGRCKNAYYCSSACQKQQWRAGHKQACRAPGQIEAGDYMKLKGLVSRPELNSRVGRVVRAAPGQSGRWEVMVPGLSNSISVATEKLVHIRPAK